jgi:DNA-entry nuclease
MKKGIKGLLSSFIAIGFLAVGSFLLEEYKIESTPSVSLSDIPDYNGNAYVNIEDGKSDLEGVWKEGYEDFSSDGLGRCTEAKALVCKDSMPTDDREDISSVTPTGWKNKRYDSDLVEGGWVYNRCHLIGFQLTGENANPENLITGTRYLNIDGMLPFENMVADYVKKTGNHVMYSVTPVYTGNSLVADGVIMEAESVEDSGSGINFDVYCYNVQPGIEIDYTTGDTKIMK